MMDPSLKEIVDRTRRIETRLTRYLESRGFDTQVQRPVWVGDGRIDVPTRACSLHDCLDVVPKDWDPDAEIEVYCNNDFLMSFATTQLG